MCSIIKTIILFSRPSCKDRTDPLENREYLDCANFRFLLNVKPKLVISCRIGLFCLLLSVLGIKSDPASSSKNLVLSATNFDLSVEKLDLLSEITSP